MNHRIGYVRLSPVDQSLVCSAMRCKSQVFGPSAKKWQTVMRLAAVSFITE
jgi:hypothetical protein